MFLVSAGAATYPNFMLVYATQGANNAVVPY